MKIRRTQSLILLMVIPVLLVVELGLGISIFKSARHAATTERNNNKLDMYLRTGTKYVSYAESAMREFQLTQDEKYDQSYKIDIDEWRKNESYYDTLQPELRRSEVEQLRNMYRQKLDVTQQIMQLYKSNARDSALALAKTDAVRDLMDTVRGRSNNLRAQLNEEAANERNHVFKLIYVFIVVIISLIVFSILYAWYIYNAFNHYTQSLEKTVTSLEDANAKMLKLNQEFKAANNYLEQLAYISAHDLKSPIHTLGGLVDLLFKSGKASAADLEIMRLQKKALAQMQQTNNGLNDILRLRQGLLSEESMISDPKPLGEIVDAVTASLQPGLTEAGGTLQVNLNGLQQIRFPFVYMHSMLYNLLANAVKFRHPQRSVVITLHITQLKNNVFLLTLADNGLGFDMARSKDKLFGIFKRFHPQIAGTGIGLHIVKSIVAAFNGDIEVTSQVDKGTEFRITIKNPIV